MPKSNMAIPKKPQKIYKEIYLDYAASTPIDPSVSFEMQKISKNNFASASSIHNMGMESKKILENATADVAEVLGVNKNEIIFTSGSTESNNLAIFGVLNAIKNKTTRIPHIVTSNIEHSSVFEICKYLEETKKAKVTFVPVEQTGIVNPTLIKKALTKDTVLVTIMYANSEIGTVQPIREIVKEIRHFNKATIKVSKRKATEKVLFHTDATQAINYLPINPIKLGVDLMSFSSVKFYGPKGVGALYIKGATRISKIIFGGDQQSGMRSGSYNLPAIVGFAEALKITEKIKEKETARVIKLRDYFLQRLMKFGLESKVKLVINGSLENRLPNNINITIPNIPSDLLVIELSAKGIMCSAKSACKSADGKASYVIQAINKDAKDADGSLRFSLGRFTEKKDINVTIKSLKEILTKLKRWYS